MQLKKLTFLFFLFCCLHTNAQTLALKIAEKLEELKQQPDFKYASISFTVLDAKNGSMIFSDNHNQVLAPASTQKLLTSATALQTLGNDFTFSTSVSYVGKIEDNTLKGDLIIKGNGDPTLGSYRWQKTSKASILNELYLHLNQLGIKKIEGNIIADESVWNSQNISNGWIWQDIGNYYGAGTSALCWGENAFNVSFITQKEGAKPLLTDSLKYPFINLINEVVTGNYTSGDKVYAYSAPYTSLIFLRGTYGLGYKKPVSIALPNPPLALAFDIFTFLKSKQIMANNYGTSSLLKKDNKINTIIYNIKSPPLSEIIFHLNQKSINLYAEQILRKLGENQLNSNSIDSGILVVKKYCENISIDKNSLFLYDGSGLSPENRVNTFSMAYLLYNSKQKPWFDSFYKSLPTINQMKMKSGTIANVLAYAGYQDSKNKSYCFSIILNNYNGDTKATREKLFAVLNELKF